MGRKPTETPRVGMSLRVTPRMKELLETTAAESGRSLTQEIELRLERSFDQDAIAALAGKLDAYHAAAIGHRQGHVDALSASDLIDRVKTYLRSMPVAEANELILDLLASTKERRSPRDGIVAALLASESPEAAATPEQGFLAPEMQARVEDVMRPGVNSTGADLEAVVGPIFLRRLQKGAARLGLPWTIEQLQAASIDEVMTLLRQVSENKRNPSKADTTPSRAHR